MTSSDESPVVAERTAGGVLLREHGEAGAYIWSEEAVVLDERA